MKILLLWWGGMLATDFYNLFSKKYTLFSFSHSELDILDEKKLEEKILQINPDIIINFASFTHVENAEKPEFALQNLQTNILGSYVVSSLANKYNITFITFSTDYVFDGENPYWYHENDLKNPINNYGFTKDVAEKIIRKNHKKSIIIRTSWLFGGNEKTKNFVNTMLAKASENQKIFVVNDQFGLPTFTDDLCFAIEKIIQNPTLYFGKILHFSNSWESAISWYNFACEIFLQVNAKREVFPISSLDLWLLAHRPKNSRLINNSDIILPHWQDGLFRFLQKIWKK